MLSLAVCMHAGLSIPANPVRCTGQCDIFYEPEFSLFDAAEMVQQEKEYCQD
jgi:hypothetical protein